MTDYDDDYPTCEATRVTLRVYTGEVDPEEVTAVLGLNPTAIHRAGGSRPGQRKTVNGWFFGSAQHVDSRDSRRHIDWLLSHISPRKHLIHGLIGRGVKADICCFWSSKQGHGGPTLSRVQLIGLADLGIDFWYDIYDFSSELEST